VKAREGSEKKERVVTKRKKSASEAVKTKQPASEKKIGKGNGKKSG